MNRSSPIRDEVRSMGARARDSALKLMILGAAQKNDALGAMADALEAQMDAILTANAVDVGAGEKKGLSGAMLQRLFLDEKRVKTMAHSVREIVALPDPVGEVLDCWTRPNGIEIKKVRVPIGVIGIIFESRPNVTVDAATLCFKAGNATILRGGSEAIHSNRALAAALAAGGELANIPGHAIQLIPHTDRESVRHMAEMDDYLDLIIPRGGRSLIETVVSLARMPVIKHYDGVCHLFVDSEADIAMATELAVNSKCQNPGVCNALETLLIHRDVAAVMLPKIATALRTNGVTLRVDAAAAAILPGSQLATEEDWRMEYLDLTLAVRVVEDFDSAVAHIHRYGSRHTDAIVTKSTETAARFLGEVDSAVVMWNASTRFNDGGEFGFGAEIGISTDKLHARGPMALPEVTSYKYHVSGTGQLRS